MTEAPPLYSALHETLDALLAEGLLAAIEVGRESRDPVGLRSIAAHVETAEWKSRQEART